ncbi:LysR family transcriptional regulator [Bordetella sp. BOR01]|uniref:LysR family transcriptional regulator n=1 Tax=Bordetella sp. BOR01 TaxID=2854779 RepID=UPI001C4705E0|nr:LysR substrate-binding domain-containing protein [Bordetella sp. BOR01]MBV7482978.1 LysR family transcriptional regulator [Bordetella sp. BOR01]
MELRHLHSFLTVAREQNFTRAATLLNVAQPPLSQRIRQLEDLLGVRLFDRNTRKVELTAAGQVFYDGVRQTLAHLDAAVAACRRASYGEAGTLRIGYSGRAGHRLLPKLLLAFRARFPDVVVDLIGPHPSGMLQSKLLAEELDIALCFLPLQAPSLTSRSLGMIDFVLAMPASHPLATQKKVALADLAFDAFVGYSAGKGFLLRKAMDDECLRAGFAPRVVRESETSHVLLCLIAAGTGVSIVPSELQHQEPVGGVVFKPLRLRAERVQHGLAWRSNNPNPTLQNLLNLAEAQKTSR